MGHHHALYLCLTPSPLVPFYLCSLPSYLPSSQSPTIPEPPQTRLEKDDTALTQEGAEEIVGRYEDGEYFEGDLAISSELLLAHYGGEGEIGDDAYVSSN